MWTDNENKCYCGGQCEVAPKNTEKILNVTGREWVREFWWETNKPFNCSSEKT